MSEIKTKYAVNVEEQKNLFSLHESFRDNRWILSSGDDVTMLKQWSLKGT